MKILVFGLSGQVGSIVKNNKPYNFDLISPKYKYIDMFDKEILTDFILEINPDVVLNLAAYTDVDGCENSQDKAFKLNAYAPRVISKACSKIGSLLLHISTDYVYNQEGNEFIKEDTIFNPKSIYGKSKYLGEKYIIENCSKYIILRTSWIYSDIGNNFYLTIKNLLNKKININVVNDQFGAPTLAYDLVNGIFQIINFMENKKNININLNNFYGVYNISNKGNISWFDFANEIAAALSYNSNEKVKPITSRDFGSIAPRPRNSRLDNTKLIKTFGIEMPYWKDSFDFFFKNNYLNE